MQTVEEMLEAKGRDIWAVGSEASAYEALKIMADKDVGALLVIESGEPVGIFSERDYARKVILKGRSSKDTTVGELMTREVVFVNPESTVSECMALMTQRRTRHLPVIENRLLRGMVSIGDVVKEIISNQDFTIREMEKYILTGH
jgi:CBS domain-containing protein